MEVEEDWDRPRVGMSVGGRTGASYYPALRFPNLAEDAGASAYRRWGACTVGIDGSGGSSGSSAIPKPDDTGPKPQDTSIIHDRNGLLERRIGTHNGPSDISFNRTVTDALGSVRSTPHANDICADMSRNEPEGYPGFRNGKCLDSFSTASLPSNAGDFISRRERTNGSDGNNGASFTRDIINYSSDAVSTKSGPTGGTTYTFRQTNAMNDAAAELSSNSLASHGGSAGARTGSQPPLWPDSSCQLRAPASPQQHHRDVSDRSMGGNLASERLPGLQHLESQATSTRAYSTEAVAIGAGDATQPKVEVRGEGGNLPPWRVWADVEFPPRVRAPLVAAGFPAPTSIQQYAWPILRSGRDLVGVAKTGSGKTLAFLLPAFARLIESHADLRGPPAVLVLAPTRELACQIEHEAKEFGSAAGMRASCLYGGAPKGPQLAELRQRPQVLVATPGRLNDLLDPPAGLSKAVDVDSVKYLVLDEADRMLDMGFEPQIRKIISGLPQERQTAMFTATWPLAVRRLAAEFQRDPAEVRIGEVDQLRVNPDIHQRVEFCSDALDKEDRLAKILNEHPGDQAIIFVNTKRMCEVIAMRTENSVAIHGDKDQRERDAALNGFKSGQRRALVATDVAARGLDIKSVKLVVNFDPPNREEDYVHRVGRTGRAGNKGVAVTLLTNDDGGSARSISDMLKRDGLSVPEELTRRLASGEMRTGGAASRGRSRDPSRSRRPLGGGDDGFATMMDDDFGTRFSGGFARGDDFRNNCMNDCPTW